MTGYNEKNNCLYVENISLEQIAKEVGTPTYVYSTENIRNQYEKLQNTMRNVLPADHQPMLCYACKANSNIAILSYLHSLGSNLEIVSKGELHRGLKAGFDPSKIVSTGVGKQKDEITELLNAGIHQFNIESLPELEQIQKVANEIDKFANVVFRLNPDISGGGHNKISTGRKCDKFGLSRNAVFKAFAMAKNMSNINATGLSIHIGSQIFEVETFKTAFKKLPALVSDLRNEGHTIECLDIGGGFPIVYDNEQLLDLKAYAQWVNDIIVPLDTKIIMEPGRYLVGNAGVLLSKVLYVKETEEKNFLVLDAAMNDLIRPTLYDAYHEIEAVQNRNASSKTYDVVGPVCETGDTFAINRDISEMSAGDLAVIKSAGAYGFCMASNYNTRPLPAEIMVNGSNYEVIRKRQTIEEILNMDIIPEWINS